MWDSEVLVCGILLCKNMHSKYVSTTLGLFSSWVSCHVLVRWLPVINHLAVFCLFLSQVLRLRGCAYLLSTFAHHGLCLPGGGMHSLGQ